MSALRDQLDAAEALLRMLLPKCSASGCKKFATRVDYLVGSPRSLVGAEHGGTALCDKHAGKRADELRFAPLLRAWLDPGGA